MFLPPLQPQTHKRNCHMLFHKKYNPFGTESYLLFVIERNKLPGLVYTVIGFP